MGFGLSKNLLTRILLINLARAAIVKGLFTRNANVIVPNKVTVKVIITSILTVPLTDRILGLSGRQITVTTGTMINYVTSYL